MTLAEKACNIEINKLKEPSGKQDQYISSYGGVNCFYFKKNDEVKVESLDISRKNLDTLENNLLLFYTGYSRRSSSILNNQKKLSNKNNKEMLRNLKEVKKMGLRVKNYLQNGEFENFGHILNEHWERKKERSKDMSNDKIDKWYKGAINNGAIGGKLVGAGGGGFLMFYATDKEKLRNYFYKENVVEVKFKFDFEGAKIIMT